MYPLSSQIPSDHPILTKSESCSLSDQSIGYKRKSFQMSFGGLPLSANN